VDVNSEWIIAKMGWDCGDVCMAAPKELDGEELRMLERQ